MIKPWQPFAKDEQKTAYKAGPVYFYEAKAGAVLADHAHKNAETLWIIEGSGQILIGNKTAEFEAPCIIEVPANVYHKFMPGTDVKFIEQRE